MKAIDAKKFEASNEKSCSKVQSMAGPEAISGFQL
jgi:hypothetical protein